MQKKGYNNISTQGMRVLKGVRYMEMQDYSKDENILEKFGRDVTEDVKAGKIDPVIGREEEILRIVKILARKTKNNPILIGQPGVGKTAIVEGFAYRIQIGNVPDALKTYQVIKVNTSALLGMDPDTGESKIQILLDELKNYHNLILFIDEIHTLMGTKGEALDFANMFKPGLDRGDISNRSNNY